MGLGVMSGVMSRLPGGASKLSTVGDFAIGLVTGDMVSLTMGVPFGTIRLNKERKREIQFKAFIYVRKNYT